MRQVSHLLLMVFFDSKNVDDVFFRNVCRISTDYKSLYPINLNVGFSVVKVVVVNITVFCNLTPYSLAAS
jgi:hypothetical protein